MKRATEKICQLLPSRTISIHALVKRATGSDTLAKTGNVISIHSLVKRATIVVMHSDIVHSHFNPRPREEGDAVKT